MLKANGIWKNDYFCEKIEKMESQDIRWKQRFDNYHRACAKIREVVDSNRGIESYSELEQEGLIQRFEYTYELAWKVMQDYLIYKGYIFTSGPNGTLQMAFEDGLILHHDAWRRMGIARNATSHIYNEEEAFEIARSILNEYSTLLIEFDDKISSILKEK